MAGGGIEKSPRVRVSKVKDRQASLHLILSVALSDHMVSQRLVVTDIFCSVPAVKVTGGRLGP